MSGLRLFLALDLPQDLRDALMEVQDDLGLGREVPEENLHLTLAFLDQQDPQVLERLHDMLSPIRMAPIRVSIRGIDSFGGKSPSLLVASVEKVPELVALQEKLAQAVRMAGIDLPRRRFNPHVTLVRLPSRLPEEAKIRIGHYLAAQGDFAVSGFEAKSFSLYCSHLQSGGAIYDQLACYLLEG